MSATHFTIYKLKDDVQWQELIDEFNDEKDEKDEKEDSNQYSKAFIFLKHWTD